MRPQTEEESSRSHFVTLKRIKLVANCDQFDSIKKWSENLRSQIVTSS